MRRLRGEPLNATTRAPRAIRVCVMGVSGAGKTLVGERLARALGVPFLEGDDLHPLHNVERMAQGIPLTDEDRQGWLAVIAARLAEARRTGTGLVVSCSALKRAYRDILRTADTGLRFVHLTGDPALIAERLSHREAHFMPAALLDSQLATLEAPTPEEQAWSFDLADPPDAIVAEIVARLAA
ncbi:MAG TPA: gluconokinase [Gemmatimonadales bacterium]|nr:gluconokinase [Gemmatimonadales bacterium]